MEIAAIHQELTGIWTDVFKLKVLFLNVFQATVYKTD